MYLELAENDSNLYLQQNDMVEGEEMSPYIFVPGEYEGDGIYVREDYFDDLPDDAWERTMTFLEANQPGLSLFGLGKKGRARRAERRERRHERKLQKIETRAGGRAGVAAAGGGTAGIGGLISGLFGGEGAVGAPQAVPGAVGTTQKKNQWLWVAGGAVLVGGAIYLATRKPRRRR